MMFILGSHSNLQTHLHNPDDYPDPEAFKPERYPNPDGTLNFSGSRAYVQCVQVTQFLEN